MNTFKSFLFFELKRSVLNIRNFFILVLIFALCMYLVHTGIQEYNDILEGKVQFQEIERLKVEQYNNYEQYGGYGFRLLFIPSPLNILFNNTNLFTELTCRIDTLEKLNIYNLFKGKNIFAQKPGKLLDFSGIILLLGSLLALFYGYDVLRHKEYLKFLSSIHGHKKVFFLTILARIIWMWLFFLTMTVCAILLIMLNKIIFTPAEFNHIFIFLIIMLLILVFFFSIGTVFASIKSKSKGFWIFVTWFSLIYLIPAGINKVIELRVDEMTSNYASELTKLKHSMDFEKRAADEARKIMKETKKRLDYNSIMKIMKSAWGKEFKEIQDVETEIEAAMKENIDTFHIWSIFTPSTFYLAANNEFSSRGYHSIIGFYEYAQNTKKRFIRFFAPKRAAELTRDRGPGVGPPNKENHNILDKKSQTIESFLSQLHKYGHNIIEKFIKLLPFTHHKKTPKIESVIKGEQNIFDGKSQLAQYFWLGFLLLISYNAFFLWFSFFQYKKSIFSMPGIEKPELNDLEVELKPKESNVILTSEKKDMSNTLYCVLSGKNKEFNGKVIIDDVNVSSEKTKKGFVYLCQPDSIPKDIKASHFISFIGRTLKVSKKRLQNLRDKLDFKKIGGKPFGELSETEKGRILFRTALLKRSDIYMFHDFVKGMPADFVKEFRNRLNLIKEDGASILYVSNDVFMGRKIGDYILYLKKDAPLMTINL